MEDQMTELKDFSNEKMADLFKEVMIDTKVLEDFLAFFKKVSKHTKDLNAAFEEYLCSIEGDSDAVYEDGKIPSEELVPALLTDQFALVQKLLLACAKFINI